MRTLLLLFAHCTAALFLQVDAAAQITMKAILAAIAVYCILLSEGRAQNCAGTSVGFTPLNDLGTGLYHGFQGGLYPGGSNNRPTPHDSAGLALASEIIPLDANGNIDTLNGRIVLLSIGMSNTSQEFTVFESIADTSSLKNPKVTIINGAQGGQTAAIISDSNAAFWTTIDGRLANAGLTRRQVQVAWVKEANAGPTQGFPRHAQILDSQFVLIARIMKARFPNTRLAFWSSRTYAGYATTALNPEPYAYESAFAVKWAIARQIAGDTTLRYAGPNPQAPWMAWGPYLWADGIVPRSDGLVWLCSDFTTDGTHPSPNGRLKVAQMLFYFFTTDPIAMSWFRRFTSTNVRITNDNPMQFVLHQNYPNPFNPTTNIEFRIANREFVSPKVFDVLGREVATLVDEVKNAGDHSVQFEASGFSSGVYYYRLQAGGYVATKKMILIQ